MFLADVCFKALSERIIVELLFREGAHEMVYDFCILEPG